MFRACLLFSLLLIAGVGMGEEKIPPVKVKYDKFTGEMKKSCENVGGRFAIMWPTPDQAIRGCVLDDGQVITDR